jgi:hypothetical protein
MPIDPELSSRRHTSGMAVKPIVLAAEALGPGRVKLIRVQTRWLVVVETTVGLILTATIVALHVIRACYAGPLWRDEISSVNVAEQHTILDFYNSIGLDSFPGLIHVLLWFWRLSGWGASLPGLRVFGLIVGLSLIGGLWWCTWSLARRAPLLSLALFALNPVVIQWGDSIRAYGVGTLLLVICIGAVAHTLASTKPSRRQLLGTAIVMILSVQCLYQGGLLIAAIASAAIIVALFHKQWRLIAWLVGGVAAAAAGSLIYLPIIRRLSPLHELQAETPEDLRLWEHLLKSLNVAGSYAPLFWLIGIIAAGLFAALAWTAAHSTPRDAGNSFSQSHRDLAIFAVLSLVFSSLAFFIYLRILSFYANAWYFIPIMGVVAICADVARAQLPVRIQKAELSHGSINARRLRQASSLFAMLFAAILTTLSLNQTWLQIHERQTNMDTVADLVEKIAADGDVVLIVPEYLKPPFQRYFNRKNQVLTLPPQPERYGGLLVVRNAMMQSNPNELTYDAVAHALIFGHKVLVVNLLQSTPNGLAPPPLPPAPLPSFGWSQLPYLNNWENEMSAFLRSRSLRGNVLVVPDTGPINDKEHIHFVLCISGWRGS